MNNQKGTAKYNNEVWATNYTAPLATDPDTDLAKLLGQTLVYKNKAYKFSIFGFDHYEIKTELVKNGNLHIISFVKYPSSDHNANLEELEEIYYKTLSTFELIE